MTIAARFRSLLSSALLICCCALPAAALDFVALSGPEAPRWADLLRERYKFWRSVTIDIYEEKGNRDPYWDRRLLEALELACSIAAGFGYDAAHQRKMHDNMRGLTQREGIDPIAHWAHFVIADAVTRHRSQLGTRAAGPVVRKLSTEWADGEPRIYPDILNIAARIFNHWTWRNPQDDRALEIQQGQARAIVDTFAMSMRAGEAAAHPAVYLDLFEKLNFLDASTDIFAEGFGELLADESIDAWLRDALLARLHHRLAWKSRGGGWASSVDEDGWKGFRHHLQLADAAMTRAWALHQDFRFAYTAVGIAHDYRGEVSPLEWIERSMTLAFDYMEPIRYRIDRLRPRWGGSYQAMLDYGLAALETERFDSQLPNLLRNVLVPIVLEHYQFDIVDRLAPFLNRPQVLAAVQRWRDGYAAHNPDTMPENTAIHCAILYHAGRRDEAKALAETLDSRQRRNAHLQLWRVSWDEILQREPEAPAQEETPAPPIEPEDVNEF